MTNKKTSFICQQNDAGKYGVTDSDGKIIVPFEYDEMDYYGSKDDKILFEVIKDGMYDIIEIPS